MSEEETTNEEESLRDTLESAIAETEEVEAPAGDESPVVQETTAEAPDAEAPETPQSEVPSAPVDWDASLREGWATLPENIREKVLDREKQVEKLMQESSGARRAAGQMSQLFNTYGSVLSAEGAQDPLQATESLFRTVSELRMGSPVQKAQKMAELINHYGIDIKALDSALVGNTPEEPNTTEAIQQAVQQAMTPYMQQQQLGQEQQMIQIQQQANEEVAKFGQTHEFINDVRMDMADLIDMAHRQGREISLEEAYDKACMMNPQVQKVMEGRKLTQQQNMTQQKLAAASSVSGSGQMANSGGPEDLRSMIAAAWDAQTD